MNTTYYQPTPINGAEWPDELYSFQVFKTYDEAFDWLVIHSYNTDDYEIDEYHDGDIEEPTFIDEYGDQYEKIEDVPDDELMCLIQEKVLIRVRGMKLHRHMEWNDQQWEDELYTEAHNQVMLAVEDIEKDDSYDFSTFWDINGACDGTAWYDSVREDAIAWALELLNGEED